MDFRKNKKIIITVALFAIFLLGYNLRFLDYLEKLLDIFFNQNNITVVRLGVDTNRILNSTTASKKELINKIESLQTQLNDSTLQLLNLIALKKENEELRAILNFKKQDNYKLLLGELTHKTNLEIERSVVVNRGSIDGIKEGNAVIVDGGILIGKIDKIGLHKSTIKLTTDNGSQILAALSNLEHNIAGVLQGEKGNSLVLNLIPKNLTISAGQKVITNGLQESIPANLYLGDIIELRESPNEIFNAALVQVPFTIEDLTVVAITIKN